MGFRNLQTCIVNENFVSLQQCKAPEPMHSCQHFRQGNDERGIKVCMWKVLILTQVPS